LIRRTQSDKTRPSEFFEITAGGNNELLININLDPVFPSLFLFFQHGRNRGIE
jgi:hypothetical protein